MYYVYMPVLAFTPQKEIGYVMFLNVMDNPEIFTEFVFVNRINYAYHTTFIPSPKQNEIRI